MEDENSCAKCCKTKNIIERLFTSVPEFRKKIDISYEDIQSKSNKEKYGNLNPPVIIIDDHILIEGHVPIMKKLARELFKLIESMSPNN